MDNRDNHDNRIRKAVLQSVKRLISVALIFLMLVTASALPDNAYAASKKKAAVTYSVSVQNINSDTVMKRGRTLRIKYKAIQKKKRKISRTKVGFKSSNKKIATVSTRGVIKAKKKGTVYITVYCKKKPAKRKTVKIRVGTPVTKIKMSGQNHLFRGRSTKLRAAVNRGATNRKLKWRSSNTAVATVSSAGLVRARSGGTARIYAAAADGSGIKCGFTIYVHDYSAADTRWIAHRGLHTNRKENTAAAFEEAGRAGFWGCECDIWETKHLKADVSLPEPPEEPVLPEEQPELPDLTDLRTAIENLPDVSEAGMDGILDSADDVKTAWRLYEDLSEGMEDRELSALREALVTGEGEEKTDLLEKLFTAYERVYEYESFELVVNHDQSYKRVHGVNRNVWDMTDDEVKSGIQEACFLSDFMRICNRYGMTPVVEIKGTDGHYVSDEGLRKIAETIMDEGGKDLLARTYFISFDRDSLARAKKYFREKYGVEPYTALLLSANWEKNVAAAANESFSAVSVYKGLLSDELYGTAKGLGLGVGTWTYSNNSSDESLLQKHIYGRYALDFVTMDYKPFK